MRSVTWCLTALVCANAATTVHAQELRRAAETEDHTIVYEIGAAGDWEPGEAVHPGGTFAFEITPIEHWLELEIGVTAIATDRGTELSSDILFKKPWQLSPTAELMIGAGPEIVRASGSDRGTFWGAEGVIDLMFWPKRNVGWYVEPGYELVWRGGTRHQGLAMAVGLLIGR